jgi:predicted nucleic acid-binding protein
MMTLSNTELDTDVFALDSNVLLYALDKSAGKKHELCKELLADGFRGSITYFIPLQVLSEFFFVVSRGKVKADIDEAEELIRYMIDLPNFVIKAADEFSLLEAVNFHRKYDLHYWDALIVAVMKKNLVSNIYTENEKHLSVIGINAVNPFS